MNGTSARRNRCTPMVRSICGLSSSQSGRLLEGLTKLILASRLSTITPFPSFLLDEQCRTRTRHGVATGRKPPDARDGFSTVQNWFKNKQRRFLECPLSLGNRGVCDLSTTSMVGKRKGARLFDAGRHRHYRRVLSAPRDRVLTPKERAARPGFVVLQRRLKHWQCELRLHIPSTLSLHSTAQMDKLLPS
jgi:hypothetical protein